MIREQFERTALLLGEDAVEDLQKKKVAVFGIGGVGGYVCEALARSGVGRFLLVDSDTVAVSNINRQIIATYDTLGWYKTEAMRERISSINPLAEVEIRNEFFLPENAHTFDFSGCDYVVDAVDTVTAKLAIILKTKEAGVPVISSMGAGNKLDPSGFRVADIYETKVCPLAKVMRKELKARGVEKLKVVYSEEVPLKPLEEVHAEETSSKPLKEMCSEETMPKPLKEASAQGRRQTPGSVAFVPSVAGLVLAGEVVRELAGDH